MPAVDDRYIYIGISTANAIFRQSIRCGCRLCSDRQSMTGLIIGIVLTRYAGKRRC